MTAVSKCIIFTGGAPVYCNGFSKEDFKGRFVIAADSGIFQLELLRESGFDILPDIILGDMDSYGKERASALYPAAEFLSFPPEKDYTDTFLALNTARSLSATDILIAGGTGNRADHYLANLALLRMCADDGIKLSIFDGKNRIEYCKNGTVSAKKDDRFKYFSILPDGEDLYGVTISGAKYPLWDARVDRNTPVSVSNEITENECQIKVTKGSFFFIVCSD